MSDFLWNFMCWFFVFVFLHNYWCDKLWLKYNFYACLIFNVIFIYISHEWMSSVLLFLVLYFKSYLFYKEKTKTCDKLLSWMIKHKVE